MKTTLSEEPLEPSPSKDENSLPPEVEDIGDTEDLQDGNVEKPKTDPEETSL